MVSQFLNLESGLGHPRAVQVFTTGWELVVFFYPVYRLAEMVSQFLNLKSGLGHSIQSLKSGMG